MEIRKSNAELLRIIVMLMIVLHHFAVHALYSNILDLSIALQDRTPDQIFIIFTHCFIYIGVNVFILISGFFSIKTSLKGFLKLYVIMVFYMLLYVVMQLFSFDGEITIQKILYDLYDVVSPFKWWFMNSYIILFLMAPILNASINAFNKKQMKYVLLLLTIANVYFGCWKVIENDDGYNVLNFIYIYYIGAYLRYFDFKKYRVQSLLIYIASSLIWGCVSIAKSWVLNAYANPFNEFIDVHINQFAYNNIFVIISAVAFFMFFMSFDIQSKKINWIAASCLAVYLIQEKVFQYSLLNQYINAYSPVINILFWIAISIVFFICAILVDKVRLFIMKPIYLLINKLDKKIINFAQD